MFARPPWVEHQQRHPILETSGDRLWRWPGNPRLAWATGALIVMGLKVSPFFWERNLWGCWESNLLCHVKHVRFSAAEALCGAISCRIKRCHDIQNVKTYYSFASLHVPHHPRICTSAYPKIKVLLQQNIYLQPAIPTPYWSSCWWLITPEWTLAFRIF